MIIYLIITIQFILAIDLCKEHLTYTKCISSTYSCKCHFNLGQWQNLFQTCSWSNNYLLGCDPTLSMTLCTKQVGSLAGEVGICRFMNRCQKISDLDSIRCSDNLSMGGCLAATKLYCKWANTCTELSKQDLENIQSNFMDLQLSISVCPLIDNYLIMHSFTLWEKINYRPDLISLASQLVKGENGNHQAIKQYKSLQLINSYVDHEGNIIWYQPSSLNAFMASNTKIGDFSRFGCISVEIRSDAIYNKLFDIRAIGINCLYCKYLQRYLDQCIDFVKLEYIFINNQCNQINMPQLSNQAFIDKFNITCSQLDFLQCQRYQHPSKPCHPKGYINSSIGCISGIASSATKCISSATDSHNTCVTSDDICYLDTTALYASCASTCGTLKTQTSCINYPACLWKSGPQINSFIYCLPLNSCDQLGLSKKYCIQAYDLCHWNGQRCQTVQNLFILTCAEATTIFTCASITRSDQFCIWQTNKCLNIYDDPSFIGLTNVDQNSIVNRNYCVSMRGGYYHYNTTTFSCSSLKSSNFYCIQRYYGFEEIRPCDNEETTNINWLLCLQLFGQGTLWDHETKSCYHIPTSTTQNCDDWQFVSDLVCENALVESGYVCLHDGISCYSHLISEPVVDGNHELNYQINKCQEALKLLNCVLVKKSLCEWKDMQCVESTLQSCKNQNQNACLKSTQACQWSDFTCLPYDYQISLVSPPSCHDRYNTTTYSCIPMTQDDDCIMAISSQQCLSLKAQCQYLNYKCIPFEYNSQMQCTDYMFVTKAVCQNSKYACKFSEGFCVDFSIYDSCEREGLSKSACISITRFACTWQDKCIFTKFDESQNQCDSKTIRNPQSCSQINFSDLPCGYYQEKSVCTNIVNLQSECTLQGLNEHACYRIKRSPCQFVNGKCIDFDSSMEQCQIKNVNALSCASIRYEPCAYDEASNSCYLVFGPVPCTTNGLNKVSCRQSNCNWDSDNYHCQCQIHNNICTGNDRQSCVAQNCKLNSEGQCQSNHCEDLNQCTGYVGSSLCYLNNDGICQGAQTCEDIIYGVVSCSSMYINGSACQNAGNQCASAQNYNLICQADCSFQFCKQDFNRCRPYQCSDYEQDKCNSLKGCILKNNSCIQVSTCSEISDLNQCNSLIVEGEQCHWQEYSLMDTTKLCTANWCQLYGPSKTLCNGNEINGRSCLLNQFYECQACEQILDSCLCQSSNACYYSDHKCKSMLCSNYLTQLTCQGKCRWSNHDSVCRKPCVQNIREADCRNLSYECNWNKHISLCQDGAFIEPDLSFVITTDYNYGQILIIKLIFLQMISI